MPCSAAQPMDPIDPTDAQQIVAAYTRVLERDLADARHPARLDTLPFAKSVIRTALRTCTRSIEASGQMTDELREFLETAYVSLAEYLAPELADLMMSYREAADRLMAMSPAISDKTSSQPWRALAESSPLAGEIARVMAEEADGLRHEFLSLISA